jgi:hypothetical protein
VSYRTSDFSCPIYFIDLQQLPYDLFLIIFRALKLLPDNGCVRVNHAIGDLFKRVLLLFSPPDFYDVWFKIRNPLLGVPLSEWPRENHRTSYPVLSLSRTTKVHRSRDEFVKYCRAVERFREVTKLGQDGQFLSARKCVAEACAELDAILSDDVAVKFAEDLPAYLRRFCLGTPLCATLEVGVRVCDKLGDAAESERLLRGLLDQELFLSEKRDDWYARLLRLCYSAGAMYEVRLFRFVWMPLLWIKSGFQPLPVFPCFFGRAEA